MFCVFKPNKGKAKNALKTFFAKDDTLSLGVCNGCQLFVELGLLNPEHQEKPKMLHNDSGKFECAFTSVEIKQNNSQRTLGLISFVHQRISINTSRFKNSNA